MSRVSISKAVAELRADLEKAAAQLPEGGIGFEVETIDVELQLAYEVSADLKVEGGWSLLGWNFGGESTMGTSSTGVHTVKLSLKPKLLGDENANVTINATDNAKS